MDQSDLTPTCRTADHTPESFAVKSATHSHKAIERVNFERDFAVEFDYRVVLSASMWSKYGCLGVKLIGIVEIPWIGPTLDEVPDPAIGSFDFNSGRPFSTVLGVVRYGAKNFGDSGREFVIESDEQVASVVSECMTWVDGPLQDWLSVTTRIDNLMNSVAAPDGWGRPEFARLLALMLLSFDRAEDAVTVLDRHYGAKLHFGERKSRAPKFEMYLLETFDSYRAGRDRKGPATL